MQTSRCLLFLLITFQASLIQARTITEYIGAEIPRQITVPSAGIYIDSDTLYMNGRPLARGTEYRYSSVDRTFVLEIDAAETDTLTVIYSEVPAWVGRTYGREIPEVVASTDAVPIPQQLESPPMSGGFAQDIKLSGAKTFRFNAQSSGANDFGQSLDLKITGELAPGLELTGALTDRGYDPTYGTATSRLSELDRLNLQLKSHRLLARIGDITLPNSFGGPGKNVSGASMALSYPRWTMHAAAARPKGRFASVNLTGENGFQGPYQVGQQGKARPIVPGSETVYLDGRPLERGLDKDYTFDYPNGQITFSVRNPIDRRSRIEIDFEPQATTYRQELLGGGGSAILGDSLVIVSTEMLREGDDRDQLLLGELSEFDKGLLQSSGDVDPLRSGIRGDTSGNYTLVADSLPDSVFMYVGPQAGQYDVTFSYVGRGQGDYLFLGSDNYRYAGSGKGDYLPMVQLPRPVRSDYFQSTVDIRTAAGQLSANIRHSTADRNLFSEFDDNDNSGLFYSLDYIKEWQGNGRPGKFSLQRRVREATFAQRERLNVADFTREYFLPVGYVPASDEIIHRGNLLVNPFSWLTLEPNFAYLRYTGEFGSSTGGGAVTISPGDRLSVRSSWQELSAERTSDSSNASGSARTFTSSARYRIGKSYSLASAFEQDQRDNDYFGVRQGTRYNRWSVGAGSDNESILYERLIEDSLMPNWSESAKRDRVTGSSNRRIGNFSYSAAATWQNLREVQSSEEGFLGRATMNYVDNRRQLNVSSSYLVSEEQRYARGITYLEVESGRGNFILENGRYIPDQFGNFIQVEELLSTRARVRRGEKSFQLSKDWELIDVRFTSQIQEELLESGERSVWWAVPFLTDMTQPYLYFSRRYDSDLRLLPWGGFHAINLLVSDDIEERLVGDTRPLRRDSRGRITFKQFSGILFFEESLELFRADRDAYYGGIGVVDGYRIGGIVRRVTSLMEVSGGGAYRNAKATGQQVDLYSLLLGSRLRVLNKGELRSDIEVYRQIFDGVSEEYSYQLTESKYGTRGLVWTLGANYGVRQGLKINVMLTGRHSDDRPGRVTGRGEVVASF